MSLRNPTSNKLFPFVFPGVPHSSFPQIDVHLRHLGVRRWFSRFPRETKPEKSSTWSIRCLLFAYKCLWSGHCSSKAIKRSQKRRRSSLKPAENPFKKVPRNTQTFWMCTLETKSREEKPERTIGDRHLDLSVKHCQNQKTTWGHMASLNILELSTSTSLFFWVTLRLFEPLYIWFPWETDQKPWGRCSKGHAFSIHPWIFLVKPHQPSDALWMEEAPVLSPKSCESLDELLVAIRSSNNPSLKRNFPKTSSYPFSKFHASRTRTWWRISLLPLSVPQCQCPIHLKCTCLPKAKNTASENARSGTLCLHVFCFKKGIPKMSQTFQDSLKKPRKKRRKK